MVSNFEELFNFLDSDKRKEYSYDELYNLGKSLDYKQRVKYDYKLNCIMNNESYKVLFSDICHEKNFIRKLIKHDDLYYILSYIEDVIGSSHEFNKELFNYLKSKYDKISFNMKDTIDDIIINNISINQEKNDIDNLSRVKEMIIMLCNPKHGLLDIENMGQGSFSNIYKLNDKVVKVSYRRCCEEIPYSDQILLPYFKGWIGKDYIEITDYLDNINNIDKEELYKVYKDLREQSIMWVDPSIDNLRRINKTALSNNESKKYLLNRNGLLSNQNYIKKELFLDDIVVIDLDHMVFENEVEKINYLRRRLTDLRNYERDKLEQRYLEEKKDFIDKKRNHKL